ncbi:AAA family ATPase, partial [Anaerostipes sp.]
MIDTIHGAKASAIIYPIDFAMMSDGAKRVFMILTRIILANVSLIAIEEPENSVHPSLFQAYIRIMHKCLYFYHIETYLRDNTPCNIEDVKLDDMITFRVLENKRSLLKNNTECCEKIKPDQLVRTMPIVTMSSSTMEVTLGDEKK